MNSGAVHFKALLRTAHAICTYDPMTWFKLLISILVDDLSGGMHPALVS